MSDSDFNADAFSKPPTANVPRLALRKPEAAAALGISDETLRPLRAAVAAIREDGHRPHLQRRGPHEVATAALPLP